MSMTENEQKIIKKISDLSGDYKCYDNRINHEESLVLDRLLTEIKQYRANGKWIDTQPEYSNGYYKNVHVCSNCSDYYTTEYDEMNFCPKCGAKMTES